MLNFIHIDKRLKQALDKPPREKTSCLANASKKAEKIITALIHGANPVMAGTLTKAGDNRIKNCLKYDLGKGFRLVCIKQNRQMFLLYMGSHDNCDKWVYKNRNIKMCKIYSKVETHPVKCSKSRQKKHENRKEKEAPGICFEDFPPEESITQSELRSVFHGLTQI